MSRVDALAAAATAYVYTTSTPAPQHAINAASHRRVDRRHPPSFGLRNAPLVAVDLAVAVRVQLREGRLEARRDQQVLEVLVAAVREEVDDFLVRADGRNDLFLVEEARFVFVNH